MAADYHDYFIIDGRHIGRYEDMYMNCPDPWRIDELGFRLDMRAALVLLCGREREINLFLDIGAGLGLFTGFLAQALWRENPAARGLVTDISDTAVRRAEERLKDARLTFQTLDARAPRLASAFSPACFDLAVMAQVLWGLLDDLPRTLTAVAGFLRPGGFLLVSQHFPGPERQSYGAGVVAAPEDLSRHLAAAGFRTLEVIETNRAVNHHWAALLEKSPGLTAPESGGAK
jgi:SAM-dependent methyltransferase